MNSDTYSDSAVATHIVLKMGKADNFKDTDQVLHSTMSFECRQNWKYVPLKTIPSSFSLKNILVSKQCKAAGPSAKKVWLIRKALP